MTGLLSLGAVVTERLPFGSPVLGGLALALIVGAPSTWLAVLAWRGDRRTRAASLLTGVLIIGWIVVEFLFIREISFFHPLYLVVGAVLVWIGRHGVSDLKAIVDGKAVR